MLVFVDEVPVVVGVDDVVRVVELDVDDVFVVLDVLVVDQLSSSS